MHVFSHCFDHALCAFVSTFHAGLSLYTTNHLLTASRVHACVCDVMCLLERFCAGRWTWTATSSLQQPWCWSPLQAVRCHSSPAFLSSLPCTDLSFVPQARDTHTDTHIKHTHAHTHTHTHAHTHARTHTHVSKHFAASQRHMLLLNTHTHVRAHTHTHTRARRHTHRQQTPPAPRPCTHWALTAME